MKRLRRTRSPFSWLPRFGYIGLMVLGGLLVGCSGFAPQRSVLDYTLSPPFIPPSAPPPLPQAETTPAHVPSPTSMCQNNLSFVSDLTIPDGSSVPTGAILDKRWEVINSGNCDWDERYRLRLIAGSLLGANSPEQALYPARSGTHAILRILFQAPAEEGRYRSAWQAFDPNDFPFGDPVFIEIEVISPTSTP
ncbi:NBR1-Ig-like domain-containing protein [uncultured Thermanaerothrix sp.]|uniref:NBR1-Ig-like domain-containing protein n=1 Tax=uncultured Thermanaerothrix sp. TaxID=1195149 RepID=UPI00263675F6|nr:NBR1-Ig-like domain-containing protein [uncultured Thermanaerothrix sp.]